MKQITILTALFLGCGLTTFSHADVLGLKADLSYWNFEGYSENTTRHPVPEYQHALDRQGTAQLSAALEHPVPIIPNVKIKYVNLDSQSKEDIPGLSADIQLDRIDYILYYEILDNIVSADLGLGLTNLHGTVQHRNAPYLTDYEADGYAALVYGQAGVKLPFTGLSAKAEAVLSRGSDTSLTDLQAEVQYNFIDNLLVDVGAKAGYRIMKVDAEQSQAPDLKLEFKGPYVGLDIHF